MATPSSETSCLSLSSSAQQQAFADQLMAGINSVFSLDKRNHLADLVISQRSLKREVDAARPDPDADEEPTAEEILLFSELLTSMSQSHKNKDDITKWAIKALAAAKALVGDADMAELQKLYPIQVNSITEEIDALSLVTLLRTHWETVHGSGSTFTVLSNLFINPNEQATSAPAYPSYALALQKITNQCGPSDGDQLALSILFSSFCVFDRNVQGEVDKTYKYVNAGGQQSGVAHEYIDNLGALDYCRLMDEAVRTFRHNPAGIALPSISTPQGCSRHPNAPHTDAECKAQKRDGRGAAAAKPKTNAKLVCYNCEQLGHPYWKCPTAADAKAKLGHSKAAAKKPAAKAHAAADISALTTAVMAALQARDAALCSGAQDEDGNALNRANAFSSCSKLISARVGLDSLANRHLFNNISLFEKNSIRKLKNPLHIEGVGGGIESSYIGNAFSGSLLIHDCYFAPRYP